MCPDVHIETPFCYTARFLIAFTGRSVVDKAVLAELGASLKAMTVQVNAATTACKSAQTTDNHSFKLQL